MIRALHRLLLAAGGAALGGLVVALLEARAVGRVLAAGTASPPTLTRLALADLGVLLPVALGVAAAVFAFSMVLEPEGPKTPGEHLAELRAGTVLERLRKAALGPLVVMAAFAWLVGSAYAARRVLSEGKPSESGLTLGVASVGLLLFCATAAAALFPWLRRALARASSASSKALDPALTSGVALALAIACLAIGVATGDTGGGGGVLGIFGVLKRDELDLSPVANLAVFGVGAYAATVLFGRERSDGARRLLRGRAAVPAGVATALVLGLFGVSARAATELDADATLATALSEHAPLGRVSLKLLRRASDGDKDGFAAHFGGGDCDDRDGRVNPGALDVPGNGVDEDCTGADTPKTTEEPEEKPDPRARPARTYNVVLITVDTLRTDLGFMGYDQPVSPNLDALARRATVFERAYAMASYTGKSVGPIMIGRYPSEAHTNFSHFNRYGKKNLMLAERLHDAGVHTFAGMCHWYFRPSSGLTQGFDEWDMSAVPPGMKDNDTSVSSDREADLALKMLAAEVGKPADAGATDAGAGAGAADAGDGATDAGAAGAGRFFAWFHFFDPHAQYVKHEGAPAMTGHSASKNAYDGEVWFVDKHVGRVLDYIAAQPWGKDTAIVVTADHGEAFADHGMSWHGREIWESLVRVPLVVYVPGAPPRRVPVKRSQIDLAPTILDLMGVPATSAEGEELRGKSLLADVYLPEGASYAERDVYIDMPAGPYNALRRALITGPTPGMKLLHFGGRTYQLYDLATDPAEKKNLARDKDKLRPVLDRMQALRGRLEEIAPQHE